MARKNLPKYKEGAPWNSKNFYRNTVWYHNCKPGIHTGIECYSFVMDMLEYASDYKYEIKRIDGSYKNLPKLHVGDGVRLNNDKHSVLILAVHPDGHTVTVAEGNSGGKVHWGRKIDLADPKNGFTYLSTFWDITPNRPNSTTTASAKKSSTKTAPKNTATDESRQPTNQNIEIVSASTSNNKTSASISNSSSNTSISVTGNSSVVIVNSNSSVISMSSNGSNSISVNSNDQNGTSKVFVSSNGDTNAVININGTMIEIEGNLIYINGKEYTIDENTKEINLN